MVYLSPEHCEKSLNLWLTTAFIPIDLLTAAFHWAWLFWWMKTRCSLGMFNWTSCLSVQHYPLYRVSDASCTGQDAAPAEERHLLFREKYDVLSKEASQRVSTALWIRFRFRLLISVIKNIRGMFVFRKGHKMVSTVGTVQYLDILHMFSSYVYLENAFEII